MPKLSPIRGKDLILILEKLGFRKVHQKGSHARMEHPDGRKTSVPLHSGEKVGVGLLRKIMRDTNISRSVNSELKKQSIKDGVCSLFLKHTTAALTTADLDPGTDQDYLDAFEKLVPKLEYRHPHDPAHTPDHILSSLIGTSLTLPVENGQLVLGTWQRVVLIEFDGPRKREIVINLLQ